jgi:hypothetical protein
MYSFTSAELLLHMAGELTQPLQGLLEQQLETNKTLAQDYAALLHDIQIVENIAFTPSAQFLQNLEKRIFSENKQERLVLNQ